MPYLVMKRLVLALAAALAVTSVSMTQAQELPPRPTAIPTAPERERPTAVPAGRITGTVIDQTSGAPVAGVAVRVGNTTVISDANGNYDRNALPEGEYEVALVLAPDQGAAAQGVVTVQLATDATVVQHLFFRSLAVAAPAAEPVPAALPATGASTGTAWALPIALLLLAAGWLTRRMRAE